jgi:DNA-binding response OmpR family regulator
MCAYDEIQKRILIIDDDVDLLMLLERRLLKEGYAIETAASLPEAEEIIPAFEPHLVLLDINVKGEDGRKLCWKLKKHTWFPDIKVIMMSGYDYDTNRSVLFGADELVAKPLLIDYLLQRTKVYLEEPGQANAISFPLNGIRE